MVLSAATFCPFTATPYIHCQLLWHQFCGIAVPVSRSFVCAVLAPSNGSLIFASVVNHKQGIRFWWWCSPDDSTTPDSWGLKVQILCPTGKLYLPLYISRLQVSQTVNGKIIWGHDVIPLHCPNFSSLRFRHNGGEDSAQPYCYHESTQQQYLQCDKC